MLTKGCIPQLESDPVGRALEWVWLDLHYAQEE